MHEICLALKSAKVHSHVLFLLALMLVVHVIVQPHSDGYAVQLTN